MLIENEDPQPTLALYPAELKPKHFFEDIITPLKTEHTAERSLPGPDDIIVHTFEMQPWETVKRLYAL